ncbi:hypothetical protein Q7P37_005393 [Cladosporium fusiforme]
MRASPAATWATWLSLIVAPVAAGPTWWLDNSCKKYWPDAVQQEDGISSAAFDKIMAEVVQTVKMGHMRIAIKIDEPSPEGSMDQWYYDEFMNIVWGGQYNSLQQLEKASSGRQSSDIRIYCDNDSRWKELVMDEDGKPKKDESQPHGYEVKPLAKEYSTDLEEKVYLDETNLIKIKGVPSCHKNALRAALPQDVRENRGRTIAMTAGGKAGAVAHPYEKLGRVSMTICDHWLNIEHRFDLMSDLPVGHGLFSRKADPHIDDLRIFTSMTMLHELHHHSLYRKSDHAYDWKPAVALEQSKAQDNADSYAMFGVAMRGLEKGYNVDLKTGDWKKDKKIPKTKITKRQTINVGELGRRLTCEQASKIATGDEGICQEFTA